MKIRFIKLFLIANVFLPRNLDHVHRHLNQTLGCRREHLQHLVVIDFHEQAKSVLPRPLWNEAAAYQLLVLVELQRKIQLSARKSQHLSFPQRNRLPFPYQMRRYFLIALQLQIKRTYIQDLDLLRLDQDQPPLYPLSRTFDQRNLCFFLQEASEKRDFIGTPCQKDLGWLFFSSLNSFDDHFNILSNWLFNALFELPDRNLTAIDQDIWQPVQSDKSFIVTRQDMLGLIAKYLQLAHQHLVFAYVHAFFLNELGHYVVHEQMRQAYASILRYLVIQSFNYAWLDRVQLKS